MTATLQLIALPALPLVKQGDDLSQLIYTALQQAQLQLQADDIVIIAQKIVSKAEGRFVNLADVTPSAQAQKLAELTSKSAAYVEVVLWDTAEIIRARPELLIVEHKLGFICANAGLDYSNVSDSPQEVLRLPADPDSSARAIRQGLAAHTGVEPPVLIIDSHGRPWRLGTVGVTIGLSGLAPVQNLRGEADLFGVSLQHTEVGLTDQLASAASLLMGQAAEGCPVVIGRGLALPRDETAQAKESLRPKNMDTFR